MALAQKDLEDIVEHIQKSFPILQEAPLSEAMQPGQNTYWLERSVKVEEELLRQRELLEKLMHQMDKRFEQVDKRFAEMQSNMDKRFEIMQNNMDKRFEQVDKRFEIMQSNMDKRFNSLQWTIAIGFTLIAVVLPLVFKYL